MSRLEEALDRLERAVARLEAARGANGGAGTPQHARGVAAAEAESARLREIAAEITTHVDSALAKLGQALGEGG